MPGLLKALFDTERKSKTSSEKPSLASLSAQIGSQTANQARQATISGEKFLVPSIEKTEMNPSELPLLPKSSSAVGCDKHPRLPEPLHAGATAPTNPIVRRCDSRLGAGVSASDMPSYARGHPADPLGTQVRAGGDRRVLGGDGRFQVHSRGTARPRFTTE